MKEEKLIPIKNNRKIIGYLAIDSTLDNSFSGGIRMDDKTTIPELKALAHTMTLKYAFAGIPFGGAKAVLLYNPEKMSKAKKTELLTAAGKSLSPLLKKSTYLTGTDLGTTSQDIEILLNAAGAPKNCRKCSTEYYTALTVFLFGQRCAKEISLKLENATVAIEGFGKVGGHVARFFSQNGSKIVAVSTRAGAIYNSEGFSVEELLHLREAHGSEFVKHVPGAQKIPKEKLLLLPVDILSPCAKSRCINKTNAHSVRARIIVPGANIPFTSEAEEILHKSGLLVIPDFAANCGGVLGAVLEKFTSSSYKTEQIIRKKFPKKIEKVFNLSKRKNISLSKAAMKMASDRFLQAKSSEGKSKNLIHQTGLYFYRKGIIPKFVIKLIGPHYITRKLLS